MVDRSPNFQRLARPVMACLFALNMAGCKVGPDFLSNPCQPPIMHSQPIGPGLNLVPEKYLFEDELMIVEVELPFGICDPRDGKVSSLLKPNSLVTSRNEKMEQYFQSIGLLAVFDGKYISDTRSLTGWGLINHFESKPLVWFYNLRGINFNEPHNLVMEWRNWTVREQTVDGNPYPEPKPKYLGVIK